jgi:hypothetical protein
MFTNGGFEGKWKSVMLTRFNVTPTTSEISGKAGEKYK